MSSTYRPLAESQLLGVASDPGERVLSGGQLGDRNDDPGGDRSCGRTPGRELLVLGLNPAWQRLFSIPHALVPGEVHRLPAVVEYASGKGINAARVLQTLGVRPVVAHFLGGATGDAIAAECARIDLAQLVAPVAEPTRICTTLAEPDVLAEPNELDSLGKDLEMANSSTSGSMGTSDACARNHGLTRAQVPNRSRGRSTELIERSPRVDETSSGSLMQTLAAQWARFGAVLICGTFPDGFEGDRLALLDWSDREVMIDAVRGCDALLQKGVALLKVNESEIRGIFQRLDLEFPAGEAHSPEFWDSVARRLRNCWPVRDLVVTRGAAGAVLVSSDGSVILLPGVSGLMVRNTIGAGDAFLAGWASARQQNRTARECLVRAQAVALARCEVDLPWDFSVDRVAFWESRCLGLLGDFTGV